MANKNLFTQVQLTKLPRNTFSLSHDHKLSCRMGALIPVCTLDCIPGDKFNLSHHAMVRMAPMVAPIMHRLDVTFHTFFVPTRLVWPQFEQWISGQEEAEAPFITYDSTNYPLYRIQNYMGVPRVTGSNTLKVSAIPFAAFQLIWNEYYRDQNLQVDIASFCELGAGDNSANAELFFDRNRAWEHDYFTSCLPWAQKGSPADIPIGNITLSPSWIQPGSTDPTPQFVQRESGIMPNGDVTQQLGYITVDASTPYAYNPAGSLINSPTTITDLRRAFKIQEWLEKNARGGTRYTEFIRAHFGVISSDARLQRPEYITGSKAPVVISEVLNTTGTDELPQGNMSGHGISVTDGRYGSYYCEEYGYIICLMSVLPKTAYQQGLPRHFSRFDPFDYYNYEFAHIGEQEVLTKEIYADTTEVNQNLLFGYNPRYSEYKYHPSRVSGQFQTSLDTWHMGRIFDSLPALNEQFVVSNPTKRIFAVTDPDVDELLCHVYNEIKSTRPMPFFGDPQSL